MMRIILIIISFICLSSGISHAFNQKIKVVASIAPLADFARQVGKDRIEVILLLPPGASPHTYEPTPKTMQAITKAKIFVKIGAGLEFWTDRLINSANRYITSVDCSEGVDLITDGHHADPHIWLDPNICLLIIKKIEDALIRTDPSNASYYRKNADNYKTALTVLDREIMEKVKTFRTKEYVTFHPAWNYFSRRYGLRVAGVIEEGPGREPAPKHINRILKELKRIPNRIIFAEPQFSTKTAEAIAREAGGQVLILDPVGGQKNRETYIDLMRYNLSIMERAMK